jgi:hypothetical protein
MNEKTRTPSSPRNCTFNPPTRPKRLFAFAAFALLTAELACGDTPDVTKAANPWLSSFSFTDPTNWTGDYGTVPLSYTNLDWYQADALTGLVVDSTNTAWLRYPIVDQTGLTNLTVDQGSLAFWFAPNWLPTNQGGIGPQQWARLIEVGAWTTNASGEWWSLMLSPDGENFYFSAQGNGAATNYLIAPTPWTTNEPEFHYIVLTYSATNSAIYVDGSIVTNGPGVTCYPGSNTLANGFCVCSDGTGVAQARGTFTSLYTYSYPQSSDEIALNFLTYPLFHQPLVYTALASAPSSPTNDPGFRAITGPGYLTFLSNAPTCITSSNVWITNAVVTRAANGTLNFRFELAGGSNSYYYDVFATTALGTPTGPAPWAWFGQGRSCAVYLITNLPPGAVYFILGQPLDSDNDGLTDAFEKLVSHSDPLNPDTFGTGLLDGFQIAYFGGFGIDPFANPAGDGWSNLYKQGHGMDPRQFYTPPPPSGLTVKYYGVSSNLIIAWNPSPGPVTNYIVRRAIHGSGQTDLNPSGQTSLLDTLPAGAASDPNWPPTYQVQALYPGGPSSWTTPGSIYAPNSSLQVALGDYLQTNCYFGTVQLYDPSNSVGVGVIRGPQGKLDLVTGWVPPGVGGLQVTVTPYSAVLYYPETYDANYLWEDTTAVTNSSGGYLEISASALQSGTYQLPDSIIRPFGNYDISVRTAATNGTVSDCRPVAGFPSGAWTDPVALAFLDGRRQIKDNAEFQLRAAQGTQISGSPPQTNEVPFAVDQHRRVGSSYYEHTEAANAIYVWAGFHYFLSAQATDGNSIWAGAGLRMDALRPFEQNYFYGNFLWNGPLWGTNLWDCSTSWCTPLEVPYASPSSWDQAWEVDEPTILFPTGAFAAAGTTNAPASILSSSATQWIFLGDALWSFAADGRPSTTVYSDFPNLYGLRLLSVKSMPLGAPWNGPPGGMITSYPGNTLPDGYAAYFFEVERPQFTNVSYYFARSPVTFTPVQQAGNCVDTLALVDPRPGEPGFTTEAATPLMIAPFGRPLLLTAWAKMAILNGFTNKFAYLEQYFDKAYKINTDGSVSTNQTGVLSPYGEFFPTDPGPVALVTMPDIDTGQRGTGVVSVIKLQLDVNHDGVMDLGHAGPDNTSQARPALMWLNNDHDEPANTNQPDRDLNPWGNPPKYPPDYSYGQIRCSRNLEDFARLWICGVPTLPTNQNYSVQLAWSQISSGAPALRLYWASETNGGIGYLTNTATAAQQIAEHNTPIGEISPTTTLTLPANVFSNGFTKYFLYEAGGAGSGQLTLIISQGGTNILAQTSAWFDFHDITDLYEQVLVTNVLQSWPDMVQTNLTSTFQVLSYAKANTGNAKQSAVFIHGWRMTVFDWYTFSETMFKRLWWQGYQGRFAALRWPTRSADTELFDWFAYLTYNRSEHIAFESGTGAAAYLNGLRSRLPDYTISGCAHSMGGIVTIETLKELAAAGRQPVDNWVLMQAAVPAQCFDPSVTNFQTFLDAEALAPTPNTYLNYAASITNALRLGGRISNFFNTNDFALATWEANQFFYNANLLGYGVTTMKPNAFFGYSSDGTTSTLSTNAWNQSFLSTIYGGYYPNGPTRVVTNGLELMPFVARPRTLAVGEQAGVRGQIQGADLDLGVQLGFTGSPSDHSGQFNRNVQEPQVWPFYSQLRTNLFPQQ